METTPTFGLRNETDVRETILRPLIERLGYRLGTDAYIWTEWPLRYSKAFLGRKNAKRDPDLVGRADYICGVVSFGCWVAEAKPPTQPITQDDVEQAHTYAAHPEIAATHFLVANGHEFKLFQTSSLASPVLHWQSQDTDDNWLRLFNVLSPAALRKRAKANMADPGKPLARGWPSQLRIIGGKILYEEQVGNHPLIQASPTDGLLLAVAGGSVRRSDDGRIVGHIEVSKSAPLFFIGEGASDPYDFFSASEIISDDPEHPTIFQNLFSHVIPAGKLMNFPGLGQQQSPFECSIEAFTEAVGYIEDTKFVGTMRYSCDLNFSKMAPQFRQALALRFGSFPDHGHMAGTGRFEVELLPDI